MYSMVARGEDDEDAEEEEDDQQAGRGQAWDPSDDNESDCRMATADGDGGHELLGGRYTDGAGSRL